MPEDLNLSQIGCSPLPPPFRGPHSPGVRKHCQIIFACYFRKSSISTRITSHKYNNKDLSRLRLLSHGMRVNTRYINSTRGTVTKFRIQELCKSPGGRPGLSVLTSLLVSVDVKQYWTMPTHWSQLVPNMSTDIRGH